MKARQVTIPGITQTNKIILILLGGFFLVTSGMRVAEMGWWSFLLLTKESFMGFQLLSYALIETNIMTLLFNGLLFWFLGAEIEGRLGTRFYRLFLLLSTLAAGLIFLICSYFPFAQPFAFYQGTGGVICALLVAYGILFAERELHFMFFFPVKAKYFVLLILAIQVYGAFFSLNKQAALAHIGAMLTGFLLLWFRARALKKDQARQEFKDFQKDALKKSFRLIKNEEQKGNDDPQYWQ